MNEKPMARETKRALARLSEGVADAPVPIQLIERGLVEFRLCRGASTTHVTEKGRALLARAR